MFYAILKTIHLLSIIVWIRGMVFMQFFLRPAATTLDAPERVRLMHDARQTSHIEWMAMALLGVVVLAILGHIQLVCQP